MSEQETTKKSKPRKHRKKNYLIRILIVVLIIAAVAFTVKLPYFDIDQVAVIGNRTVSDEEIVELSRIKAGDSIFLINPILIKHRIHNNMYIEDISIKRKLPGTVKIIVTERKAAAMFVKKVTREDTETKKKVTKKFYVVTDANGKILEVTEQRKRVTIIPHMTVTSATEGEKIQVKETGVYNKAMKLIAAARKGDLYFKRIVISGSRVQAYIYDELVCKGRYQNVIRSIDSGELKSVVYRLYQQDISKGTINIGDNNYCSFTPEN